MVTIQGLLLAKHGDKRNSKKKNEKSYTMNICIDVKCT